MLVTLGFLAAGLLALAVLPALARRADRLARRRAERQFPLSLGEIAADRDRLRAELALRERAAEQKTDAARKARAEAMEQVGRRDMTIAELGRAIEARDARITVLEGDLGGTRDELDSTRATLTSEQAALAETRAALEQRVSDLAAVEGRLAKTQAALSGTSADLDARTAELADMRETVARLDGVLAQRERELGALMTEADALRVAQIESRTRILVLEGERDELGDALAAKGVAWEAADKALAAMTVDRNGERLRADALEVRAKRHEMALAEARDALDAHDREIAGLKARLAQEEAMRESDMAARTGLQEEIARLHATLDAEKAKRAEALAGLDERLREAESERDDAHAELRTAQGALAQARSDRTKLKRELGQVRKGKVPATPDNAALRREIVEVAERLMTMTPKREAAE